jgi:hypothetical protein
MVSVGWPGLCGPPVEGSTISLSSQVLRRFGPALSGVGVPFWDLSRLSLTSPMIFPSFSPGIASLLLLTCSAHTDPVEGKQPAV